jgi:hypothetical protein
MGFAATEIPVKSENNAIEAHKAPGIRLTMDLSPLAIRIR